MTNTSLILAIPVILYTALGVLYIIWMLSFDFRHRDKSFATLIAQNHFYSTLNQLRRRKPAHVALMLMSVCTVISWLTLALPLADMQFGTNWTSSFTDEGEFQSYLGRMDGNAFGIYFMVVLFGIAGVKVAYDLSVKTIILLKGPLPLCTALHTIKK